MAAEEVDNSDLIPDWPGIKGLTLVARNGI
jgi:hypothetical protein